jgi:hypothetical protein
VSVDGEGAVLVAVENAVFNSPSIGRGPPRFPSTSLGGKGEEMEDWKISLNGF